MSILPQVTRLQFSQPEQQAGPPDLGKTFQYDFGKGDFILQDGKLISAEDLEALKVWVEKILRTEKFRFEIYRETSGQNEYGATLEDLIGNTLPRSFVDAEMKREIREALTRHPRIETITNFSMRQDGSTLVVVFKIVLSDGRVVDQEVVF